MRFPTILLAVASLMLAASFAPPASAADRQTAPSAERIEMLLRDWLADEKGAGAMPSAYAGAELLDFRLVGLEPLASGRWFADTELSFDFGPPPSGVIGYQRRRQGRYQLMLDRRERGLGLIRFTPRGSVLYLPRDS